MSTQVKFKPMNERRTWQRPLEPHGLPAQGPTPPAPVSVHPVAPIPLPT